MGVGQAVEVEAAQPEAHLVDVGRVQGWSGGVELGTGDPHKLPPRDVHILPISCREVNGPSQMCSHGFGLIPFSNSNFDAITFPREICACGRGKQKAVLVTRVWAITYMPNTVVREEWQDAM